MPKALNSNGSSNITFLESFNAWSISGIKNDRSPLLSRIWQHGRVGCCALPDMNLVINAEHALGVGWLSLEDPHWTDRRIFNPEDNRIMFYIPLQVAEKRYDQNKLSKLMNKSFKQHSRFSFLISHAGSTSLQFNNSMGQMKWTSYPKDVTTFTNKGIFKYSSSHIIKMRCSRQILNKCIMAFMVHKNAN